MSARGRIFSFILVIDVFLFLILGYRISLGNSDAIGYIGLILSVLGLLPLFFSISPTRRPPNIWRAIDQNYDAQMGIAIAGIVLLGALFWPNNNNNIAASNTDATVTVSTEETTQILADATVSPTITLLPTETTIQNTVTSTSEPPPATVQPTTTSRPTITPTATEAPSPTILPTPRPSATTIADTPLDKVLGKGEPWRYKGLEFMLMDYQYHPGYAYIDWMFTNKTNQQVSLKIPGSAENFIVEDNLGRKIGVAGFTTLVNSLYFGCAGVEIIVQPRQSIKNPCGGTPLMIRFDTSDASIEEIYFTVYNIAGIEQSRFKIPVTLHIR